MPRKVYGRGHEEDGNEELVGISRDGRLVWRTTVNVGALPNTGVSVVPHGLSIETVVKIEGVARDPVTGDTIAL